MATSIKPISEAYAKGIIEGIIVVEDKAITKYRIIYTEKRKDEWIRFDHKPEEPSHVHLRAKTNLRSYEQMKKDLDFLVPKFSEIRKYFGG